MRLAVRFAPVRAPLARDFVLRPARLPPEPPACVVELARRRPAVVLRAPVLRCPVVPVLRCPVVDEAAPCPARRAREVAAFFVPAALRAPPAAALRVVDAAPAPRFFVVERVPVPAAAVRRVRPVVAAFLAPALLPRFVVAERLDVPRPSPLDVRLALDVDCCSPSSRLALRRFVVSPRRDWGFCLDVFLVRSPVGMDPSLMKWHDVAVNPGLRFPRSDSARSPAR